jgi:hypothetical protein
VIGGLALTNVLSGFLPSGLNSGFIGYLASAAIAVVQGKVIGKVSKNGALGNDFMVGGLAYVAAQILNSFLPSVGSYTGISGGRGVGLLGGSNFFIPQVNIPGSMGSFMIPGNVTSAIGAAIPAAPASAGMGRLRRTGRLM